jgi:tetratricopeptide (TPR) repeat protein
LLYLKGRDYWSKRDVYRSAECFRQAIDKDPGFALAYSGLADSYSLMDDRPANETMPKAKEAAMKALEIDNTLAEAHTSLAYVLFRYDWDLPAAEAAVKRAIELNPNYGTAHEMYATYLLATERPDEALKQIKRAQELDPLSVGLRKNLGTHFLYTRQYDKALEVYRKTLELDPNAAVHGYLGLAYQQKGMFDEAFQETQKMFAPKLSVEQMEELRQAYATSGYPGLITTEIKLLKERANGQYESSAELARLCATVGQKDEAFEWLNKAYEARADALIWIKVDPRYDNLRSDPRFSDLLKRVGLANN